MIDELGDRMKLHEAVYTEHRVNWPYIYARIDGRGFSKFTKKMARPYDYHMLGAMQEVTKFLVDKTHALIGYHQSDEISLLWEADKIMFDRKVQKLCSVLAGMASSKFTIEMMDRSRYAVGFNPPMDRIPHFDCRVIGLPDEDEATNAFLWRLKDCRRNAISMVAQSKYSHKSLQGMSTADMKHRLVEDGIYIDSYIGNFTDGTYWQRQLVEVVLTQEQVAKIPKKHRPEPNVPVIRTQVKQVLTIEGKPWETTSMINFKILKDQIFNGNHTPTIH
jgi:tRNA(His) guanylyltransferase